MILRLATANENGRRGAWPIVGAALCVAARASHAGAPLRISRRPGIFIGDTETEILPQCHRGYT